MIEVTAHPTAGPCAPTTSPSTTPSSPSSGTTAPPTSAPRPSRCCPRAPRDASAGCPTTAPATAARHRTPVATSPPRRPTSRRSPTPCGLDRFAVLGHSGGAPHALACAALLPDRVVAAVSGSGLAPYPADGLDWFAGINPAGTAELRAAVAGRAALEQVLSTSEYDPEMFTPTDHAALEGDWGWLGRIAGEALEGGIGGMVDDDLAYVAPWGFDPATITAPVLLLHGDADRVVPSSHARWLADRIPSAELWLRPGDGHVSVLGGRGRRPGLVALESQRHERVNRFGAWSPRRLVARVDGRPRLPSGKRSPDGGRSRGVKVDVFEKGIPHVRPSTPTHTGRRAPRGGPDDGGCRRHVPARRRARLRHRPAAARLRLLGAVGRQPPRPDHGAEGPHVLAGLAGRPERHVELERALPLERGRQPPGRHPRRPALLGRPHAGAPLQRHGRGRPLGGQGRPDVVHPDPDRQRQARRRLPAHLRHEGRLRPDHRRRSAGATSTWSRRPVATAPRGCTRRT